MVERTTKTLNGVVSVEKKKVISKLEAYKAMDEIDFKVMDQELEAAMNSDQRGKRTMTHQFYLDNEGFHFLEICWDDVVVQTLSIGRKPTLKSEIPTAELERIADKQSKAIKQLHKYVFQNENIKEEEREFILANLATVIRLY
jgi:hypothetical protein